MDDAKAITIYSAPWCAFCHMAKRYLDDLKITYKDIDVDSNAGAAQELVAKTGQAGIPVILIGETTIIGFNKAAIDAALDENKLK